MALRIAMLAPLKRPITPTTTVSRNRVIVDLTSQLLKRGHAVTIFGTGDSQLPGVDFRVVIPASLQKLPPAENAFYQHTAYLTQMVRAILADQNSFDIVHNHMYPEFYPFAVLPLLTKPMLTTVHAQMTPDLTSVFAGFPEAHLVALSDAAMRQAGRTMDVVHNGIDADFFVPDTKRVQEYFLFIGRMSRAKDDRGKFLDPKGVTHAIAAAYKTNERLKIVGSVEDPLFFETLVQPLLSKHIEYVGTPTPEQSMQREDVKTLYQEAKALLLPIQWEEPFGLVMIEAMACGTPVIAYNRGSVSEIVKDGLTGFVVDPQDGIDGFVNAIKKLTALSSEAYQNMRRACRKQVEEHFTVEKMVDGYERIYKSLIVNR